MVILFRIRQKPTPAEEVIEAHQKIARKIITGAWPNLSNFLAFSLLYQWLRWGQFNSIQKLMENTQNRYTLSSKMALLRDFQITQHK